MIHDGHRERLRAKADKYGFRSLEDHEALELLLGFCLKRCNTNEIAHRLIDMAGSLHAVFSLSPKEIRSIKGLGVQSVFFLRLIGHIMVRPPKPAKSRPNLSRMSLFTEYAKSLFDGCDYELLYVVLLDKNFKLVKCSEVAVGSEWQVGADKARIARTSLEENVAAAVLIHNHPRGEAKPTRDDLNSTVEIERTFEAIGIPLLEHFVYANGECYPIMRRVKQSLAFAIEYDDVVEDKNDFCGA